MFNDLILVEIGKIRKTHGVNGQVRIIIKSEFKDTEILEKVNPLFVNNRGLFIPFDIEDLYPTGKEYIVKLLFCDSLDYARELCECKVFVEKKDIRHFEDVQPRKHSIINYSVISEKHGDLGVVSRINEIPGNPVIEIKYENKLILVPYVSEIVKKIDHNAGIVNITPPDGLIEMYL